MKKLMIILSALIATSGYADEQNLVRKILQDHEVEIVKVAMDRKAVESVNPPRVRECDASITDNRLKGRCYVHVVRYLTTTLEELNDIIAKSADGGSYTFVISGRDYDGKSIAPAPAMIKEKQIFLYDVDVDADADGSNPKLKIRVLDSYSDSAAQVVR